MSGLAFLAATGTAAAAPTTLVDQTIDKKLGGAQVCVVEKCLPEVQGITNVHLKATFDGPAVSRPAVEQVSAPGCTANVNLAYKLTTAGAGPGGTLTALVEFDRTDKNGNVIPGSHNVVRTTVVIVAGAPAKTINPLVSLCATVPS